MSNTMLSCKFTKAQQYSINTLKYQVMLFEVPGLAVASRFPQNKICELTGDKKRRLLHWEEAEATKTSLLIQNLLMSIWN